MTAQAAILTNGMAEIRAKLLELSAAAPAPATVVAAPPSLFLPPAPNPKDLPPPTQNPPSAASPAPGSAAADAPTTPMPTAPGTPSTAPFKAAAAYTPLAPTSAPVSTPVAVLAGTKLEVGMGCYLVQDEMNQGTLYTHWWVRAVCAHLRARARPPQEPPGLSLSHEYRTRYKPLALHRTQEQDDRPWRPRLLLATQEGARVQVQQ